MVNGAEAKIPLTGYPLVWPDGWRRVTSRESSNYRVSQTTAMQEAHKVAARFAYRYSITANVPLRLDGIPLASQREPHDPGVAFWWRTARVNDPVRVIACDRWRTVRENYRAISHAIEALASLKRSGASAVFERSMQSFEFHTLPAPVVRPPWFITLSLPNDYWPPTRAQIQEIYRTLVQVHHPDKGGNVRRMQEINIAHAEAQKWLTSQRL